MLNADGGRMAENPLVMTVVVNRDGGVTPVMNLGQGGDVVGDLMMALRALGVVQDNLREALLAQVGERMPETRERRAESGGRRAESGSGD